MKSMESWHFMQGNLKCHFYIRIHEYIMNRNNNKFLSVHNAYTWYIPESRKPNPFLIFICPVRQLNHGCLVILNVTLGRWCHLMYLYCMLGRILSIIVCKKKQHISESQIDWIFRNINTVQDHGRGAAGIIMVI